MYVVLGLMAAGGLVIWLLGRRAESNRMVSGGFGMLLLGLMALAGWGIYLSNMKSYAIQVRYRAESLRGKVAAEKMRAAALKKDPDFHTLDFGILKDEERAKRVVRLLGWDWKEMVPPPQ